MDFALPQDLADYLGELDRFIEAQIKPSHGAGAPRTKIKISANSAATAAQGVCRQPRRSRNATVSPASGFHGVMPSFNRGCT